MQIGKEMQGDKMRKCDVNLGGEGSRLSDCITSQGKCASVGHSWPIENKGEWRFLGVC